MWGLGRSRAREGLQEQSNEKSPDPGKGLWDAAMPRFSVARITAGMRVKVARPVWLYECWELSLDISVEDEGCSGQGPEVPEKTRVGENQPMTLSQVDPKRRKDPQRHQEGSPGDRLQEPPTLEGRGGEGRERLGH